MACSSSSSSSSGLPVGYRFRPTEEELVSHFLQNKLQGRDDLVSNIREIVICNYEPWDLPAFSLTESVDDEWFFFSRPNFKSDRRNQINRATNEGFWKITGKEKPIKAGDNRTVIGKKRFLTFHRGRVRNCQITKWVIHEYYIPEKQSDWVLCRLIKKPDNNTDVATTCDEGEPSTHNASAFEINQPTHDTEIPEPQGNLDYFQMARDLLLDAHSNNDGFGMQYGFELANEPDNDVEAFLNSVIVDQDQDSFEETTHTAVFNDSTLPQSSRRIYVADGGESSDTDLELVAHQGQVMSSQMFSELPVGSSHSRRDKAVMLRNQFLRQSESSVSAAPKPQTERLQLVTRRPSTYEITRIPDKPLAPPPPGVFQINSLQLVTDDYYSNENTPRRTYPRTEQGKVRELKQQQNKAKEASERRAAVDFPPKKFSITESSNVMKLAEGKSKGMKETQNTTTASNWKGSSFISWEPSPVTSPLSAYILNTVVGAILFVILARELVLYGQWS